MVDDEDLPRIVGNLVDFKDSMEDRMNQDPSIRDIVQRRTHPDEVRDMQEQFSSIAERAMKYRFDIGEPDDAFYRANVKLVEKITEIALRVMPKADVAACMPAELLNQTDADFLRGLGANTLADLCTFDPEAQPATPAKKPNIKPKTTF